MFILIHLYIVLIQGISPIFVGRIPTLHVFRKGHSLLALILRSLLLNLTRLKNEKAQFKVALRNFLNTLCLLW